MKFQCNRDGYKGMHKQMRRHLWKEHEERMDESVKKVLVTQVGAVGNPSESSIPKLQKSNTKTTSKRTPKHDSADG